MYKYRWNLDPSECQDMKREIYLSMQYSALYRFLIRKEDVFEDQAQVEKWKMEMLRKAAEAKVGREMERLKFERKYLRPYCGDKNIEWVYLIPEDVLELQSEEPIEFPAVYLNRPPKFRIEDHNSLMAELFRDRIEQSVQVGELLKGCRTCTFQVTDACNLKCTYCYQINKCTHVMEFDTVDKMVEILLCNSSWNPWVNRDNCIVIVLDFIGGEPFLAVDVMEYACTRLLKRMFETAPEYLPFVRFSTCSNGVLYDDPKVQKFIDDWQGLLSFSVTLDGDRELHDACRVFPDGKGSFDYAYHAIECHRAKGYVMGSKVTIAPGNVSKVYQAIRFMLDEGYTDIHANCVFEEGWNFEHAKVYYGQLKKLADLFIEERYDERVAFSLFNNENYRPMDQDDNRNWCGGTGSMLAVDWKGDIFPCVRYMESSLGEDQKPLIIGNVDRGLVTTVEEKCTMDCLHCITRRSQSSDECFNCSIAKGCAWCSAHNYQCFGTVDKRATFICCMHKAEALANVYYWNTLYLQYPDNHVPMVLYISKEWALDIISESEWNMLKELEGRALSLQPSKESWIEQINKSELK